MKNRSTIMILGAAQFIMVLDTTVMNVSISQVVSDLDTTVSAVQLAITAYALVMAAFMLTGAKLGDMFGRRRIFSIGLGVYGAGSLITALSPNVGVLLFGWSLIEGIGACLVIPAIAALTAANYDGKERALAFGLLGGIAGAGVAAGPLIGGFVTSALTWRVVFAAETVVVAAVLLFGVRRIKDSPAVARESLDKVGAALSALGLGLVVLGILKSSQWGLITPTAPPTINGTEITPFGLSVVPFVVAAGFGVLIGFRHWEQRVERAGRQPLLRPGLLASNLQLRGGLTMFVSSYLIMAGSFFVLPLYLQLVLGKDALDTGIAILPISVAMIVAAVIGGRLADRVAPRRISRIGLAILFVGLIGLMSSISPQLNSPLFSVAACLLRGRDRPRRFAARQRRDVLGRRVAKQRGRRPSGLRAEPRKLSWDGADRVDSAGRPDDRLSRSHPRRSEHPRRRSGADRQRHRAGRADGLAPRRRVDRGGGRSAAAAGRGCGRRLRRSPDRRSEARGAGSVILRAGRPLAGRRDAGRPAQRSGGGCRRCISRLALDRLQPGADPIQLRFDRVL